MKENYVIRRICRCIGILSLFLVYLNGNGNGLGVTDAKENIKTTVQNIFEEDDRLELVTHETYESDQNPVGNYMYDRYTWVAKSYSEEEMAEFSHAYFDERNRLRYVLGYSAGILGDSSSYCEENIYEWDDDEHNCRYIYYKSNSMPYDSGYYVAYRYMFEVSNYKFDADGRLLTQLSFSRNVGSDRYGYSDELLHRINRSVIGWDENLILPGMRLYIPEAGNAQDTKIRSY